MLRREAEGKPSMIDASILKIVVGLNLEVSPKSPGARAMSFAFHAITHFAEVRESTGKTTSERLFVVNYNRCR